MTKTKSAYKYESLLKGPYESLHTQENINFTLITGAVATRINIRNIKPYTNLIVQGRNSLQEV